MQAIAHNNRKPLLLLIGLAVIVNFSGLFVHLMDPDAGVYASISRNMVLRHDWINLWFQDKDWLDKPHFPFWITAIFFKIFGIHDWSYKLPGILFVMMGAWYTYLFARRYYNEQVALWSVFILLSAVHILISNNDVRAEPFLTGLIIASVYHFTRALSRSLSIHLVFGCLFAACAMMTKGLFTLVPIGGAIAGHLLITRQWKQLFHWRWLLAIVLTGLFIIPELYCLWVQFDQHPEKLLFGRTNVSGIRFFLWDSQFGRFMNTGPIKGKGDPTFFLHTLLWAFLPWAFLMYAAMFIRIRNGVRKQNGGEWYMLCGSLLTFFIFSISKFQLPYYTNIVFPFFSVLTAVYIHKLIESNNRPFAWIQNIIALTVLAATILLYFYYQPQKGIWPLFLVFLLANIFLYLNKGPFSAMGKALPYLRSGMATLTLAVFMNCCFYPDLLQYQSGNEMAFYVNKEYPNTPIGHFGFYMPSGEFYLRQPVQRTTIDAVFRKQVPAGTLLFLSEDEVQQLLEKKILFETIKAFPEFHITMLNLKFLNPSTRKEQLKKYYLIRLLSANA